MNKIMKGIVLLGIESAMAGIVRVMIGIWVPDMQGNIPGKTGTVPLEIVPIMISHT